MPWLILRSRHTTIIKDNKMKKQVFNPYLPSYEYIPDGEPHVFGDRVYVYGSHDKFNGKMYCMNNYVCYSAPVDDLSDWRFEGVIYDKKQDPFTKTRLVPAPCLYAPDVTQGPDGRYYLYYAFDFRGVISVAVCDTPAGEYKYYGDVHYTDGQLYGKREGDKFAFDPGVLTDDDGRVWLYSGFAPQYTNPMMAKFFKNTGNDVIELEQDMLTIKSVKDLIVDAKHGKGTEFEGHEFYEASSIRKFDGKYYFIYSSTLSHELAYAVSDHPDRDYRYGGSLHSNGDFGISNEAQNFWGNNHGSIERINGKFYVFGHRQTNWHEFSRQGIAEEIEFKDGKFLQAELTSCGLNGGPLVGKGTYEARIACNLTAKDGAQKSDNVFTKKKKLYPAFTQTGKDRECDPDQYIANMTDGSTAGFKYFDFNDLKSITVLVKGKAGGKMIVTDENGDEVANIAIKAEKEYRPFVGDAKITNGKHALFFTYVGSGAVDFKSFDLK